MDRTLLLGHEVRPLLLETNIASSFIDTSLKNEKIRIPYCRSFQIIIIEITDQL